MDNFNDIIAYFSCDNFKVVFLEYSFLDSRCVLWSITNSMAQRMARDYTER